MIPTIGSFVGLYIITRMLSLLTRPSERSEKIIVKVFAGITILVTVLGIFDLILTGTTK